ncbi:ABC transporter permease [Fusibacter paucivorans]|uniref:ABC transporter permease n=2 Tax=Fusibacter paucivorans TaxID=76009 RepID=A0ABS5PTI7_9FIRM|nr:ABC transporter permease [Fusibacter paucivorans]
MEAMPFMILGAIVLITILAPLLAPFDPEMIDMQNRLSAPTAAHILGTDSLGRDTFSRVLYGGRQSILLAFAATLISMGIGTAVGFVAGYYGGKADLLITGISNVFLGIPGVSIMVAFAGVLGPGMNSLLIAVTVNSWVGFSRIVRGEVMQLKHANFIEGMKSVGASDGWIFIRHVLPNLSDSLIILFATKVGSVVLSVASLSYLGLGLQPPAPDWAIMISDARPYFREHPLLMAAPGAAIITFVWSVHAIGDYMRDKLDVNKGANDAL